MFEEIKCPICEQIGKNIIDISPVKNHPNLEERWLVCACGHDLMEVKDVE